ncbi:polysaccharide biosynthesis/export family protein [Pseudolabrys sp. FHR47]|uniref:polysaccharide biosynthesis/export family protein n=1 Tax=Pseudolabrys sp. FHR47 TaxID=2562284 RepID=UPI003519E653
MRNAKILLVLMAALAAAGCARKTAQVQYIIDPQTGQPVPVVTQQQQYAQAQAYPAPAPQAYPQTYAAPATSSSRSLYSSSAAYAQQAYAQAQYVSPQPTPQPRTASGRGLFSSGRQTQTYVQPQPALRQPYVAQYTPPPAAMAQAPAPQAVAPRGGPYIPAPAAAPMPNYGYAAVSPAAPAYTLDSGDKLRVVVFGQDGITNSYTVDAGGNVNLPLIGAVPARGTSTQALAKAIADRLRRGYVREPHVTVEVETYRPFFILGEVTTPGQYPYVANMTVETAVAIAGGFGPRASKKTVELTRNAPGQQMRGNVPLNYPLLPGDTIVIKERWF